MSWKTYVDKEICEYVKAKQAIIASLADGSVWAKKENPDEVVTEQELKVIADTMKANPSSFLEHGVYLASQKFICLHADNNLIRGRKGSSALSIVATKSCLLVVTTEDGFPAGNLNTVVERLGDYLIAHDY